MYIKRYYKYTMIRIISFLTLTISLSAMEPYDSQADLDYKKGFVFYEEKNFNEAFAAFYKAAKADNLHAMYQLRYLYLNGIGIGRDYEAANEWLDKMKNHKDYGSYKRYYDGVEEYYGYINLSDSSITDDEIANAIKSPKPKSVTSAIDEIKNREIILGNENIISIDLSKNYITLHGAVKLLTYTLQSLPNLQIIDLSYNRIYEWPEDTAYDEFTECVANLVKNSKFQKINLSGNCIITQGWFQKLAYLTKDDFLAISKIVR